MSPMRLVACESAVSSVSGSSWPGGRNSPVPMVAGPSARNSESNFALSASRARLIQWSRSKSARGLLAGSRHEASWWPASIRNALRCSCRRWSATGRPACPQAVVAGREDVLADLRDADLLLDLADLEERVAEGLLGLD